MVKSAIAPIEALARQSPRLSSAPVFRNGPAGLCALPRYIYCGLEGGGDPIPIGIFAGIHGDEPATTAAVARFAQTLLENPELSRGYHIYMYPVCNPSGFVDGTRHSRAGKDLNREFWKNSCEPEVILLESEIRSLHFQGLISLHSDDTSDGMYGFVRGHVLTRALLEPALLAAETFLPRNTRPIIDGFPASNGIISECYDGILASPPNLDPNPFETILETPHGAPQPEQVSALNAALQTILTEYPKLLAYAANL